jgi:hypothetical protein
MLFSWRWKIKGRRGMAPVRRWQFAPSDGQIPPLRQRNHPRRRGGFRAEVIILLIAALLMLRQTSRHTFAYFVSSGSGSGTQSTASQFAPTGLTALSLVGAVQLWWNTPAGNWATGYRVYRAHGLTGDYTLLTSGSCAAPVSGTSCTDRTVSSGTYRYIVRGISTHGGSAVNSNEAVVEPFSKKDAAPTPVVPSSPSASFPVAPPEIPVLPVMVTISSSPE